MLRSADLPPANIYWLIMAASAAIDCRLKRIRIVNKIVPRCIGNCRSSLTTKCVIAMTFIVALLLDKLESGVPIPHEDRHKYIQFNLLMTTSVVFKAAYSGDIRSVVHRWKHRVVRSRPKIVLTPVVYCSIQLLTVIIINTLATSSYLLLLQSIRQLTTSLQIFLLLALTITCITFNTLANSVIDINTLATTAIATSRYFLVGYFSKEVHGGSATTMVVIFLIGQISQSMRNQQSISMSLPAMRPSSALNAVSVLSGKQRGYICRLCRECLCLGTTLKYVSLNVCVCLFVSLSAGTYAYAYMHVRMYVCT